LRQVALYIVAMNLDPAERVVSGHDEDTALTISEAVQASTALPGFYKPARIKGVDYVDGGVRRTANIDVAIEHGAELVICYNPFRPFHNRVVRRYVPEQGRYVIEGRPLASQGMLTVLNQVLRTLLHSRLQLGIQQYQDDPNFQGDIILLEPGETDLAFFKMAPLSPPAPSRPGRPVMQAPRTAEGQTAPAGTGGQPGGGEEKGSKRLGRPILVVPSPHVGGAARRAVPAHSASEQRRQPGGGAT